MRAGLGRGADVGFPELTRRGILTPAVVSSLQRSAGNAAITALLVQRAAEEGDAATPAGSGPEESNIQLGPIDHRVELPAQEPIAIPPPSEMGDYPLPDKDAPTAQADGPPHPSADIAVQYPWTYQGTVIYRDLNLTRIRALNLDIVREPQISLSISPESGLVLSYGITLINWHWKPPWKQELELGLSGLVDHTLLPRASSALGGQIEAEQHILPWFSLTFSVSGMYTPPLRGNPGKFEVSPGGGAVFHFN